MQFLTSFVERLKELVNRSTFNSLFSSASPVMNGTTFSVARRCLPASIIQIKIRVKTAVAARLKKSIVWRHCQQHTLGSIAEQYDSWKCALWIFQHYKQVAFFSVEVGCIDREGRPVPNGARYAPDEDPCKMCNCADGMPQLCTLVQCSPPACEKWRPVQNECCQFKCIDDATGSGNSTLYRYGFG